MYSGNVEIPRESQSQPSKFDCMLAGVVVEKCGHPSVHHITYIINKRKQWVTILCYVCFH